MIYKTRSELALSHLESLNRPLTDEESDQLRRAMHAVYCRNRARRIEAGCRDQVLRLHEIENERTLNDVLAEVGRQC